MKGANGTSPNGDRLASLLALSWPPMRNVRDGWERLTDEHRALVSRRLEEAIRTFRAPTGKRAALRRFFSFLSQVEVIAIEVPLSALPTARPEVKPLLERQLADEVFHATVFAALALELGELDEPIPEAEHLLDQIRGQDDPRTTAVLLNLIAEGWIENLFDHAVSWGVADDVFRIVLEDESRHVEEAHAHAQGMDLSAVREAVRRFELDLFKLVQHPRVVLPTLALAGEQNFRKLSRSYLDVHREALGAVELEPPESMAQLAATVEELEKRTWPEPPRPRRIEPESQWRRTALHMWDAPRNPVMYGWFDAEVGHVPRRLLTPVLVAAVGRVWHEYPRLNRFTIGDEVYQPAGVNVGVRVSIGDKLEALSTIVVTEAHTRSVSDIQRILDAGVRRMNELGEEVESLRATADAEPLRSVLRDEELMAMVPPEMVAAPVTVSNVGRAGLVAGVGSMPGALGQSVEIILGRVEKRPVWRRWRYVPGDVVTIGAGADHRIIDGNHAAEAIRRLREQLTPQGVAAIDARPDTIPADVALDDVVLGQLGIDQQHATLLMSCKLPFWLGWLCWLFKK